MKLSVVCCCLILLLVLTETKDVWSPCSRQCGGGLSKSGCQVGSVCNTSVKYRVCNQQKCLKDGPTRREEQCGSYNKIPFRSSLYSWIPVDKTQSPCALVCRSNGSKDKVTVKFKDTVDDGTVCGNNSICIAGKCLEVGCDDIAGSGAVADVCGVCDGDGTSCKQESPESKPSYQWEVNWVPCSVTCGTGHQKMVSKCKNTHTFEVVSDNLCRRSLRPKDMSVKCTLRACSSAKKQVLWLTGTWSPCPVTCGVGYKYRNVICKHQGRGRCSSWNKPPTRVMCNTGVSCNPIKGSRDSFQSDDWRRGDVGLQSLNPSKRNKNDGRPLTPRFLAGDWGMCSVTCGTGVRTRTVTCKVYLDISGKVEAVPDSQCFGKKPPVTEECVLQACREKEVSPGVTGFNEIFSPEETFRWELGNYSTCTQSCLRGTQRTRLECIREKNGAIVSTSNCLHLIKPTTKIRSCNDIPCPPRWLTGEHGPCTAECGGGVQRRTVKCVQDVGADMTKTIPDYRCADPIPISEQSCNTQFCPAQWQTGNWTECTVTCGPGIQTRRAYCIKAPFRGHKVMVADTECLGPRPMTTRECQMSECFPGASTSPVIKSENYTFIQFKRSKRVKVTVGGRLVLLPGQSVTVRCPVKNYHRRLLFWSKGFKLIPMAGRVRTTFMGNLKIKKANPSTDSGTYTCMAGLESADIIIEFQTKSAAQKKAKAMKKYLGEKTKLQNLVLKPESDIVSAARITDNGLVSDPQLNISKKLVFTTGEWSPCSVTCGSGNQRRDVMCARVTYKYVKVLPDRECIKWGSAKPETVRKCSLQADCPLWKTAKWSKCSINNCVRDGFAQRKRAVDCVYSNGTVAQLEVCQAEDKPEHKQECVKLDCMSMWQTSAWSECRPFCGEEGFKTRMLTCVWRKTRNPAWSTCKRKPRPSVKKPCTPRQCQSSCQDMSRYCSIVGMLKMCRVRDFRQRCCHTCRTYNTTKPKHRTSAIETLFHLGNQRIV
ncbi:protein madd-4-like isoform X1 [Haliotis asinina]|uniref:protein madd-4-like isoform X1 n=1 Tax=Haliotis asinina TaxID=109174 RepID=UPI0035326C22